jgi:serine protease Do
MNNLVRKRLAQSVAALGGVALLAGTSLALTSPDHQNNPSKSSSLNLKVDEAPLARDPGSKNSYAPIIQKVAPSVVKIFVTAETSERPMSGAGPDFFRRFFGDQFGFDNRGFDNPGEPQLQHALGSGVIVSPDGYILTNNHVVKNAKEIKIALNDGRNLPAKVVGTDPESDIALIKVNANNLQALTLTDSDKVEVGDVVLAIGNPFGVGQTVTSGIVSAKNRATSGEMDEDFIQTDAAINPGNSGGALVDTQGRLVGINTAILSRSGGSQGIGFAVPSNLCRWVMESLVKTGHVERGFLGVQIQDLTPSLAEAFKIERTNGALVSDVTAGSPAEAAGLKSGDVIVDFNGQPVEDASQLKLHVAETTPGSTVQVVVNRNGETKNLSITVREKSKNELASSKQEQGQNGQGDALHGVAVSELDQQTREELKVPANIHGAVVSEVSPNSAAYEAGLREGDVILEINHQPVKNAQDAVNLTTKPTGGETLVKVWSRGGSHYLTVNESNVG